jgi:caffeoyl-CoA O-methyltransferase
MNPFGSGHIKKLYMRLVVLLLAFQILSVNVFSQEILKEAAGDSPLDRKVKAFLREHRDAWHDLNIPVSDGVLLYETIVRHGYTRGLEIGTSTGHSTIWIAWAFSKTGGKLITLEIDESRHKEALANFREAGLLEYIDARLGDAHKLAKELRGPYDFVFSDADKDWYINYFRDVAPKLTPGGCFAAHNVYSTGRGISGTRAYLEYVKGLDGFTTTVDDSGGGIAFTFRKK